jgi:hypothetical protein
LACLPVFFVFGLFDLRWKPAWLVPYQFWIFGASLFCVAYPFTRIGVLRMSEWEDERRETRKQKIVQETIENRLKHLTASEKVILRRFITQQGHPQGFFAMNGLLLSA